MKLILDLQDLLTLDGRWAIQSVYLVIMGGLDEEDPKREETRLPSLIMLSR